MNFDNPDHLRISTNLALSWLRKSFDVHQRNGSAHSYSRIRNPIRGWGKAYPETTGYIVETFKNYVGFTDLQWLEDYIDAAVSWLIRGQLDSGAFPALLVGNRKPSVFNTAMILFGLCSYDDKEVVTEPIVKAVNWLTSNMSPAGTWTIGAYRKGFDPSYYSRVLWAILNAYRYLEISDQEKIKEIRNVLGHYIARIKGGRIMNAGFGPEEGAYTHTIAYFLRGVWESSMILNVDVGKNNVIRILDLLIDFTQTKGKLAGKYSVGWKGNYSFSCLTGDAQLSDLSYQVYSETRESVYLDASRQWLDSVASRQVRKSWDRNLLGAIPGSAPIYGEYQRFAYPNWAAKFYLDACLNFIKRVN